ncbi:MULTISPECIES: hypothetical protein [Streptomyces griseus group]|uniref:hypothetical protein n=1 Tax=Streptomyces griseus group TaxID=629295 RepID=UPI0030812110
MPNSPDPAGDTPENTKRPRDARRSAPSPCRPSVPPAGSAPEDTVSRSGRRPTAPRTATSVAVHASSAFRAS